MDTEEKPSVSDAERAEEKRFDVFARCTKKYSGRLYKHIASPEKGEHFGYLLVVFLVEHSVFRYVALIILCCTTVASVIKEEVH